MVRDRKRGMMTDKIIINNIDVSECKQRDKYAISPVNEIKCYNYGLCKDNPNCLYKQLKRKEGECEKLKYYLRKIRDEELKSLDIDLDEYETCCRETDYSNIITYAGRALGEIDG